MSRCLALIGYPRRPLGQWVIPVAEENNLPVDIHSSSTDQLLHNTYCISLPQLRLSESSEW